MYTGMFLISSGPTEAPQSVDAATFQELDRSPTLVSYQKSIFSGAGVQDSSSGQLSQLHKQPIEQETC